MIKVLFTRTFPPTEIIQRACYGKGIELIHNPLIEIQPTAHLSQLQHAVHQLSHYDVLIFMSKWAAHYAMPLILAYCKLQSFHPNLLWAAIGPGTKDALIKLNDDLLNLSILSPSHPPYDSESFLRLAEMQTETIANKRVLIFRGNNGRELIANTLHERGAKLTLIEAYQRSIPSTLLTTQLCTDKNHLPDLIIVTSLFALNNLVILFSRDDNIQECLWSIPLIVVGNRLLATAKQLGFTKLILSNAADDQTLKDVLCENFNF